MKYTVTVEADDAGAFFAECAELGIRSGGLTPVNALDQLRANMRYHLEYCPCTSLGDDCIELDVLGR
jgi:hypothetical protein